MKNRFNHIKENNKREVETFYEMLDITKKSQIENDPFLARIKDVLDWNSEIEVLEEGKESGHALRVAYLSKKIAEELSLGEEEIRNIYLAALMRDIGKHLLPKSIIGKPGPLTNDEYTIVKTHADLAINLIGDIVPEEVLDLIKSHHERMDGSGYPLGIAPSLGARIIGLTDSYEAMTSQRVYSGKKSREMAFQELERCTIPREEGGFGYLYDKDLVKILKRIVDKRK